MRPVKNKPKGYKPKMFKKVTAILLAIIFCLCAVGCAQKDEGAPEGMKSATVSGEPFDLYVPEAWTENTASGISSAYYAVSDGLSVSARYHTPAIPMTKEAYLDLCVASLAAEYADAEFALVENKVAATLGGKDAAKISYDFKNGETAMRVSQITAAYEGYLVSLYFYCPKAELEARSEVFEKIRGAFVIGGFADGYDKGVTVTVKGTPEGMKLASDEGIEYRLFVPTSWVCDPTGGASEAHYPESGKPNITVTSYVPDTSMSVSDYFLRCEEEYKKELPEYSREGEGVERQIDGRKAYSYTYTAKVEGIEIKIMQTIFVYDSSFYTITYAALSDRFDDHMADVEKILAAFKFR